MTLDTRWLSSFTGDGGGLITETLRFYLRASARTFFLKLDSMKRIAQIIFENDKGEFLLYLRDGKPGIPFPHHWDLIGGHIEEGETPEEALVREVKEELDYDLSDFKFFREYLCLEGDAYPNVKYIYSGKFNLPVEKITLHEGDRPQYFKKEEIPNVKFANILKKIVWIIFAKKKFIISSIRSFAPLPP
jgi:8-oxo-dGTP diphosphatase